MLEGPQDLGSLLGLARGLHNQFGLFPTQSVIEAGLSPGQAPWAPVHTWATAVPLAKEGWS